MESESAATTLQQMPTNVMSGPFLVISMNDFEWRFNAVDAQGEQEYGEASSLCLASIILGNDAVDKAKPEADASFIQENDPINSNEVPLNTIENTVGTKVATPRWEEEEEIPIKEIEEAVKNLGSKSYRLREEATKLLKSAGADATPALIEAFRGPDAEISDRAQKLLERRVRRQLFDPVGNQKSSLSRWLNFDPADKVWESDEFLQSVKEFNENGSGTKSDAEEMKLLKKWLASPLYRGSFGSEAQEALACRIMDILEPQKVLDGFRKK